MGLPHLLQSWVGPFLLFLNGVSLCNPGWPGTLALHSQRSTCLCLSSSGIKGVCYCAQLSWWLRQARSYKMLVWAFTSSGFHISSHDNFCSCSYHFHAIYLALESSPKPRHLCHTLQLIQHHCLTCPRSPRAGLLPLFLHRENKISVSQSSLSSHSPVLRPSLVHRPFHLTKIGKIPEKFSTWS